MPTHLMIDLETLASTPDAAVVQVGVAAFNFENPGAINFWTMHCDPDIGQAGVRVDFDTIKWWMKQNDAARQSVFDYPGYRESIDMVIGRELRHIFQAHCDVNQSLVFAAPASFDLAILKHHAGRVGAEIPWGFRQQRCMSSIGKFVGFDLKAVAMPESFNRIEHDAGNDAVAQVYRMQALYSYLKERGLRLEIDPPAAQ